MGLIIGLLLGASVFFLPLTLLASSDLTDRLTQLDWDGVEVHFLEDERVPLFHLSIYFADGSLSDHPSRRGETEFMFDMLTEGTRRYNAASIADHLEFFGISVSSRVTHEYSQFEVSGLVENMGQAMQMVCHLFQDATFPADRMKNFVSQRKTRLENLVRNHGQLAGRAFREISLQGTPFYYPTEGKLNDLDQISSRHLIEKRNYFRDRVKKNIYIVGPRKALGIRSLLTQQCAFPSERAQFARTVDYEPIHLEKTKLHFVEVPHANQSHVRIGRILNRGEFDNIHTLLLANNLIGGGFTSRLMREVRVNRGLTYSIGAITAPQRDYGRVLISSFTPTDKTAELIQVIDQTIKDSIKSISRDEFANSKSNLIGSFPFQFENSSSLISQIILLNHRGRPLTDLTEFPERVQRVQVEEVKKAINKLFNLDRQTVVILGDTKALEVLQKAGFTDIEVHSYRSFL